MKPNDRQKICPNCDGNIPVDVVICPYCASDLAQHKESSFQRPSFKSQNLQESLASLYNPPYSGKASELLKNEEKEGAFKKKMEGYQDVSEKKSASFTQAAEKVASIEEEKTEVDSGFWPLLLLSLGGNILTVGLLQFFFSDNGVLKLEWDGSYWFIYCLLSLPLIFLGFKKANNLKP